MIKPKILKIETTNRCNAQCIICTHKTFNPKRLMDMPFETVKRLIDEASTWKPIVQLSGFGEPTLYPQLVDAVKFCRKKGMPCHIYTNGMLMSPELTKKLVDAGLTWFIITVDGRDKETFEKIRVRLNFETVEYNIKEAWKICRNSKTKMRLGSVICKENKHDIKNIARYWRPYAHNYRAWIEIPLVHGRVLPSYKTCGDRGWRPWTQLVVRANGNVPFCCIDVSDEYPSMGNVHESEMLQIYNSQKFNELRKRVKERRNMPEMCKLICLH